MQDVDTQIYSMWSGLVILLYLIYHCTGKNTYKLTTYINVIIET